MRIYSLLLCCLVLAVSIHSAEPLPYTPNPEIVKLIQNLPEGGSLLLPPVNHKLDGKDYTFSGRGGPYARDYTNKMVFAPDRQTAFYAGGNHGEGRTNDVWEFHLGSNTWHCLFAPEAGDHAKYKFTMMFLPRLVAKDPNYQKKPAEEKNFEECKVWWKENVIQKDGIYVNKNGGPLLVGHTWDTLVYEPNTKRMIHGTGTYCVDAAWLQSTFTGTPIETVKAGMGKNPEGKPYTNSWYFDPAKRQWGCLASSDPLAMLRGMGGALIYIPDWKKVLWYYAGQNTSGAPFTMRTWDPVKDTWEELKPNGGASLRDLVVTQKAAPEAEQQLMYSPKHKTIVGVVNQETFAYNIEKNEWRNLRAEIPFKASDSATVYAYDSNADVFLLTDCRTGKLAAFSLVTNKWEILTPSGDPMMKPPYCVGKGYFDPVYNVFVVQSAYTNRIWLYRHKKSSETVVTQ